MVLSYTYCLLFWYLYGICMYWLLNSGYILLLFKSLVTCKLKSAIQIVISYYYYKYY